ncbi:MAG TPA: hypothetical protein VE153_20455, partial [Myxococcus sp.]|nr:hypothetical protein [Myxococcus sp.]
MNWSVSKWSAVAVAVLCGLARPAFAQCTLTPPTSVLPFSGAVVTSPPSFGWSPGQNNEAIYLNVSTQPGMSPIDVVNWRDDGKHHFTANGDPSALAGRTLYWRLVADGCGQRVVTPVRSVRVGDVSLDPHYNLVHFAWPTGALTWPRWDPSDLTTFKVEDLHLLRQRVGTDGATPDRKLGYSIHVPFFAWSDIGRAKQVLQRIFEVSTAADMPVL